MTLQSPTLGERQQHMPPCRKHSLAHKRTPWPLQVVVGAHLAGVHTVAVADDPEATVTYVCHLQQ